MNGLRPYFQLSDYKFIPNNSVFQRYLILTFINPSWVGGLGRLRWFLKANLVVNSSNCVVVLNPDIPYVPPDVLDVHEQIDDFCFWIFSRNSDKGRELQNQYVELQYVWPRFGVRRRAWNRSCTLDLGGHGGQFGSSCSSGYFRQICRRPLRCIL